MRKIQIPAYEKLILEMSMMTPAQLEIVAQVAKYKLAQLKPRGSKPKKPTAVEQAS